MPSWTSPSDRPVMIAGRAVRFTLRVGLAVGAAGEIFHDALLRDGRSHERKHDSADRYICGCVKRCAPGATAGRLRKVLADGLRYARDLRGADLQRYNLRNAYLGWKQGDKSHRARRSRSESCVAAGALGD